MRTIYVDKNIPRILLTKVLKPVWPGVIFSSLSPTHFVELPDPQLPGPRWVRVKNHQCGICATDLTLLTAAADPSIAPAALPGLQRFYLGHEVVGEVVEVGKGVTHVEIGQRVIMDAQGANCFNQEIDPPCPQCSRGNIGLCENSSAGGGSSVGGGWSDTYVTHETSIYPVAGELSDDQALMVEPLSIGMRAALRCTPEAGQHVLVVGSGTIGLCTVQALKAVSPGCHITSLARHSYQAEKARSLGADEALTGKDLYALTAEITGAKLYTGMLGNRMLLGGFDVIYDCVGTARTIKDSLRCVKAGGTVVLVGIRLNPLKLDLTPVWSQEIHLVGNIAHGHDAWQGNWRHDYDLVIDFMRAGKVTADGFITHRFPLARWHEAVHTAMDKRTGSIKVVIDHRMAANP